MREILVLTIFVTTTIAAPRPAGVEALVDRARAATPEFAADALIRIAGSPKTADRAWKRELLEEAFRRAAGAQQPLRKRAATPPSNVLAGFLDRAFSQELDTRSLQSRAVRALLPLDPAKARELLLEMAPLNLPRLTCEDALVYDVEGFYQAVGEVAQRGFTAQELASDEPLKFLQPYLSNLQSPVQVGPAAHLLAGVKLKPEHFEALVAAFAGAVKEISGDDRSFSFAISRRGRINPQIYDLVNACKQRQVAVQPLLEAYRGFLVRHLKAARCADGADPVAGAAFGLNPPKDQEQAQDAVVFFNDSLRAPPVKAIEAEEVQPEKVEGKAAGARFCDGEECLARTKAYTALLFGSSGVPLAPQQRQTPEWNARLKEYLASLANWGLPAEHFHEKCRFYSDLVNLVPNGADRETVLRAFLDFLKQNSYQAGNRMEWFLPVNSLIARVFMDPLGLKAVMQDLRDCGDPVISLYAALEELAPRSPGETLGLL